MPERMPVPGRPDYFADPQSVARGIQAARFVLSSSRNMFLATTELGTNDPDVVKLLSCFDRAGDIRDVLPVPPMTVHWWSEVTSLHSVNLRHHPRATLIFGDTSGNVGTLKVKCIVRKVPFEEVEDSWLAALNYMRRIKDAGAQEITPMRLRDFDPHISDKRRGAPLAAIYIGTPDTMVIPQTLYTADGLKVQSRYPVTAADLGRA